MLLEKPGPRSPLGARREPGQGQGPGRTVPPHGAPGLRFASGVGLSAGPLRSAATASTGTHVVTGQAAPVVVRISVPVRTARVTGVFSAISASFARCSSSTPCRVIRRSIHLSF
jgi:hypothetical protein